MPFQILSIVSILVGSFRQSSCQHALLKVDTPSAASNSLSKICGVTTIPQIRIVGGKDSLLNSWPWMAAIFVDKKFNMVSCGGVLINHRFILTAAHCLRKANSEELRRPEDMTIRLGDLDIHSAFDGAKPEDFLVAEFISHAGYNHTAVIHDIALLKLNNDVKFSPSIAPICLPESPDLLSSTYYKMHPFIAGWGSLNFNGIASTKLQQARVRVTQIWKCKIIFGKLNIPILDSEICAGYNFGGKDACQGDSGGPLMMPNSKDQMSVIGVISVGYKCAEPGYPGVYTRVASYLDWIKKYAEM